MDILKQQQLQHSHDTAYHTDVSMQTREYRLKHYALHFAKYAGRFACEDLGGRSAGLGPTTGIDIRQTIADMALVALSAANTLNFKLVGLKEDQMEYYQEQFFYDRRLLTYQTGLLCDAAEKSDHMEEFVEKAKLIINRLWNYTEVLAFQENEDLEKLILDRRTELRKRAFYVGSSGC